MDSINCPNCGAPFEVGACRCRYCGSVRSDIQAIMMNKPVVVSFLDDGVEYTFKMVMRSFDIEIDTASMFYSGCGPTLSLTSSGYNVGISGALIPFELSGRNDVVIVKEGAFDEQAR